MKFPFIASYRGSLSRSHLCRMMGVSDRGLRAWRRRPPSIRQRRDIVILAHIRDQHRLSLGSHGRPRMTEELNEFGPAGRTAPGRPSDAPERHSHHPQRATFKRPTDSDHAFNIAPSLLQQDFAASRPNQKWAGDITYVWTREGWVYLAVIIDLFSRRVIGWAISNRMTQDLAIRALNMAIALRRPPPGCIHQTDRGSQYRAHDYHNTLSGTGSAYR
ncbi:IS3 family transposase [Paracoccus aminovorans]|uniref:IS3 family transposase n=1 Tax=Paracoccus aminovorans TaxID=34004 RepID=UPI002B25D559|nr:IS3 family transposase [Paracoccus aminovorans]